MNFELCYELSLSLGVSIVYKVCWSTGGSVTDLYSVTA